MLSIFQNTFLDFVQRDKGCLFLKLQVQSKIGGLWRAPGGALEGLGELGEGLREPLGGIWRDLGVP